MLVLGGTILFCLLWYFAFAQHDYYIINLLILPVFMFIAVLEFLNRTYPKISNSLLTKVALSILLLFNINYAKGKLKERYLGEANEYKNYKGGRILTKKTLLCDLYEDLVAGMIQPQPLEVEPSVWIDKQVL